MNRIKYVVLAIVVIAIFFAGCSDKKEEVKALNENGSALYEQGKYAEAVLTYNKAIELDPQNVVSWKNKGDVLLEITRYEEALQAYDKAISFDPEYAAAWTNKGYALGSLGRYEEALQAYDKAISFDPEYAAAWNGKGIILADSDLAEALEAFDKSIELEPNNAIFWNNKGYALNYMAIKEQNVNKCEEALQAYEKSIELEPNNAIFWNNKGYALYWKYSYLGIYSKQTVGEIIQAYNKYQELPKEKHSAHSILQSESDYTRCLWPDYLPPYNYGSSIEIKNDCDSKMIVAWEKVGFDKDIDNFVFIVNIPSGETRNVDIPIGTFYQYQILPGFKQEIFGGEDDIITIESNSHYSVTYYIETRWGYEPIPYNVYG